MLILFLGLPALAQDWTLCARVSPLHVDQGQSVQFGRETPPVFWGFHREVVLQVCTLDGRPIHRRVQMAVEIEPLDGSVEAVTVLPHEAVSDSRGRMTAKYAAGGLQPGGAWPEGTVSRERHRFRFEGKEVAAYIVERSSRDLRFYPDPETAATMGANARCEAGAALSLCSASFSRRPHVIRSETPGPSRRW